MNSIVRYILLCFWVGLVLQSAASANEILWREAVHAVATGDWNQVQALIQTDRTIQWNYSPELSQPSLVVFLRSNAPRKVRKLLPKLGSLSLDAQSLSVVPAESVEGKREVLGPLFSVYMPVSLRIKGSSEEYLGQLKEGAKVTLYETRNFPKGVMKGESGGKHGYINSVHLKLDWHASNIYLEAMDVLVRHPKLLVSLLNSLDEEFQSKLVSSLIARKVLLKGLKKLFRSEIREKIQRNLKNETLRQRTEPVALVLGLLNRSPSLNNFRGEFLRFAVAEIEKNFVSNDPQSLASVLAACVRYLESIPKDSIPAELVFALNALNLAAQKESPDSSSALMGSILFLRVLCPGIATLTNQELRKSLNDAPLAGLLKKTKITKRVEEGLKELCKALQLISNQEDPIDAQVYHSQIKDELRQLHKPVAQFLKRVSEIPSTLIVEESLVRDSAFFYGRLIELNRMIIGLNSPEGLDLADLRKRLGEVPDCNTFFKEVDLPMFDEISRIRKFISPYLTPESSGYR